MKIMTKTSLLNKLKKIAAYSEDDTEGAHADADKAVLDYINDPDISEAYRTVKKWYS